ncbi:MAG TPA: thioesterase family protein [Candidatus Dormibacteraeota bacterium]|nr:thioesterase family protein [Candidatus Dormibacteraeota bacterium]
MAAVPIYQTPILAEWIDYNGHLRDAYYTLIVSLATDALMDRVGLDAAYRARSGCTLYTLEMHLHFLREIKQQDTALVELRVLGVDHKRIHAAFDILRRGESGVAASAELMLLHVRQDGAKAGSTPFPGEVAAALAALEAQSANATLAAPGSRRIEMPGQRRTP